jgi:hypothetical protein
LIAQENPMKYLNLPWNGPHLLSTLDIKLAPEGSGVYVFTEDAGVLRPNPALPPKSDPSYAAVIGHLRNTPCVLYVGKASNLRTRLAGYRFRPYLEIERRSGPPIHVTSPHKGRALLHAHQFFNTTTYVRWAVDGSPAQTERDLIRELRPVLNTYGLP